MNEEEVNQLNQRIAMEIIGESKPPQPTNCSIPIGDILSPEKAWVHIHIYDNGDECEWWPVEFAQDARAAMWVVQRLRELGCWTWIRTFLHTTQVNVEMGVPSSECQEWGNTMAEAICKCALKAKEKFKLQ